MLDWQAEEVIEAMSQSLFEAVGPLCPFAFRLPIDGFMQGWRYQLIATFTFMSDDGVQIVLAGDYFGTARLETAYLSGQRAALCLLG